MARRRKKKRKGRAPERDGPPAETPRGEGEARGATRAWRPPADLPAPRLRYLFGAILVVSGAGVMLYPAVQTREGFREVVASFELLPLWGVALVASGMALLIHAVHLASGPPRPWALERSEGSWASRKLRELNFLAVWRELDREAAADRAAREARGERGYDWAPLVVFTSGAVFLALMEYYGHKPHMVRLFEDLHPAHPGPPDHWIDHLRVSAFMSHRGPTGLIGFAWWSLWRVLGFFLLPALVIKLVLRERIVDYGLQTRGFLEHAWIYAGAFVVVLVLVVTVSYEESFQTYYPFYDLASRSWYDFWTWELLYAAQFFSLEFFFRGFWLNAAKRAMGSHAIYAMTVPYVMIHFGKPFPETIAAIFAGVALGTLALRTRSIWSGFLIHVSVAISMDVAALLQTDGLPERWWPDL